MTLFNHCLPAWIGTLFSAFIIILMTALSLQAQNNDQSAIPNVYLDCVGFCQETYIRTNVPFVNYVRDQADSHIYLRITSASTGSGEETILDFRGIEPHYTRRDTVIFLTPNTATNDEERAALVRNIRVGLIPFLANTSVMNNIDVVYMEPEEDGNDPALLVDDPWNQWIFEVDTGISIDAETSETNYEIDGGFEAERITEDWKMNLEFQFELDREEIELEQGTRNVNRDSWEYNGFIAHSLSDHWSLGLFTEIGSSQTGNIKLDLEAAPAIEYSVFPYEEFQERQWVFQYRLTPSWRDYRETTIYNKESELVARQILSSQLRYDQPWGFIDVEVSASNYLHNWDFYRLELEPRLNVRITRGLSVNLFSSLSRIRDQISLPAGDITDEERLLNERQQATDFEFSISFGFSYTFGSRFSNVVNPRFSSGGGGGGGGGGPGGGGF